jgi:rod shape-determining protein MreB and related proteins
VHLIEEALAAAIGSGLEIAEPVGRMVVDIGGGTTDVAVISYGGLVVARSLPTGGYDLDDAITAHLRTVHRMAVGSQSAEAIKLALASALPLHPEERAMVRGRDLTSGLPREIELTSEEIRDATTAPVAEVLAAIHATLEETPPELAADITRQGILMAGGGALLRGLSERVHDETGMEVRVADDPLACVALGAGMALEELDTLGRRGR